MIEEKKLYGLVGKKLGHSFSRDFFNKKFADENINAEYINFEIDSIEKLPEIITLYPNLVGLNVTIPYKEQVIPFLSKIDGQAATIGAVNTVKIIRTDLGTELHGYNTDIIGFSKSLRPLLKSKDRKALMLGSGGAAKAMKVGLENLGLQVHTVSRREGAADFTYSELTDEIIESHTVIVNSTPLGMWPDIDSAPDLPYEAICDKHVAFDAVYNPNPTRFLVLCKDRGASIKSGIEMLHGQAIAAWIIWNNTQI